ncbi:IclR family transcriptional regulator [Micromonospora sp. NBC_01655]|uniref:IclR family transcriptional regulator n=1 Tax=Micromonospora sp. NBC_01655 TaxID=2975983 RepID=UPI0022518DE8|nr:IclR family transcriptional regulator [Micromonospora sp. NBC_01655]MCX4472508.1 IclR family transcriptional regulator [Micromonospora sp. NBC_01655]
MQPVVRALEILRAIAHHGDGMTIGDIHSTLGIPLGSAHRLLAVLTEQEFVTRSPINRRYFLGPAARQLTEQNNRLTSTLTAPHPAVVAAAAESGETVFLSELVGSQVVCISLIESKHPLRLFVRIGQEMPLHAAASARALLADLDTGTARALLADRPLTSFTSDTPATPDAVIEHLAVVRARGYDVCDDELDRGVWAVAAPIRTSIGTTCASLTLAAAADRMRDPVARAGAIHLVLTTAARLSAELGYISRFPSSPSVPQMDQPDKPRPNRPASEEDHDPR